MSNIPTGVNKNMAGGVIKSAQVVLILGGGPSEYQRCVFDLALEAFDVALCDENWLDTPVSAFSNHYCVTKDEWVYVSNRDPVAFLRYDASAGQYATNQHVENITSGGAIAVAFAVSLCLFVCLFCLCLYMYDAYPLSHR